ncbi:MAG: hypothetical protein BWY66_00629 [bacterium ADurb.Bin374]|nr:MAG: hypothetical protein BWY66_00629 [bacterium ADurb.Bin374]
MTMPVTAELPVVPSERMANTFRATSRRAKTRKNAAHAAIWMFGIRCSTTAIAMMSVMANSPARAGLRRCADNQMGRANSRPARNMIALRPVRMGSQKMMPVNIAVWPAGRWFLKTTTDFPPVGIFMSTGRAPMSRPGARRAGLGLASRFIMMPCPPSASIEPSLRSRPLSAISDLISL